MNRLAKFVLPILIWMIPGAVFALGLGEIHVRSKLNEALDAEIELLYSDSSEPQATEVGLASAEDFRRVGLDPTAIRVPLTFEIAQDTAGRYLIRVSSAQPIGDPFVDFLIEVNWPNGRLLREYVVLLDPPVTAPAEVAAISEPPPTQAPRPMPQQESRREPAPAAFPEGGSYEVRRGDTLWEIARDRRPARDITINQMMMMLYQMNPDAFFADNISALKAGAVLRMPGLEDLQGLPVAVALSQVRTQNQAWENYRQSQARRTPTVSDAGVSPEYVRSEPAPAAEDESRLELVPAAGSGATEVDGARDLASLRADLARTREELVSEGHENSELRSRVDELESLISNLERAITLKDADLADLQNQIELANVEPPSDMLATDIGDQAADLDSQAGELSPEELLERELDVAGASPDASLTEQGFEDDGQAATDQAAASADEAAPADSAAPTRPPQPGIVDKLLSAVRNPLVLSGLGVAVLLGVGGFFWSRRRSQSQAGESLVDRMMASEEVLDDEEQTPQELPQVEPDDDELMAAVDRDPQDARAHLALLRSYYATDQDDQFTRAAERMREDIGGESHPAWMEVKAMGANLVPNHPLFVGAEAAAEPEAEPEAEDFDFEISDAGNGGELPAESAVDFDAPEVGLDEGLAEDDDLSLDFELEEGDLPSLDLATEESDAGAAMTDDEMSLDFDLGPEVADDASEDDSELAIVAGEEASRLAGDDDADLSLDFDLDEAAGNLLSEEQRSEEGGLPDLDVDDLGAEDEAVAGDEADTEFDLQAVTPASEADTELDLDLNLESREDADTEEQPVDPEQVIKESATLAELESSDEDLGLDDLNLDESALFGDDDAVGTKLDLAKAYIDMGDPEGARGMLEEVLAEGNSGQKEEAEDLLGRLAP